jgi:hypothetical protein
MKRLVHSISIAVVLGVVLLALPSQVSATTPEEVVFNFDLHFTGPDSAAGSFSAAGAINDAGTASEVFRYTDEGTVQGVKTLVGSQGTIAMRFNAEIIFTGPTTARAEAHWTIESGTGAYENIRGVGTGDAVLDFAAGTVGGPFPGTIHFDP